MLIVFGSIHKVARQRKSGEARQARFLSLFPFSEIRFSALISLSRDQQPAAATPTRLLILQCALRLSIRHQMSIECYINVYCANRSSFARRKLLGTFPGTWRGQRDNNKNVSLRGTRYYVWTHTTQLLLLYHSCTMYTSCTLEYLEIYAI